MSEKKIKTSSGIEIKEVYTDSKSLELPGEFPFTRGIQKDMYRGRMWTMRQYAFGLCCCMPLDYAVVCC